MRLLIVENEKEPIQMYTDVIESFNKQSDVQIYPFFKDNLADGLDALKRPEYDAAIIDLKLSHDTVELEGLEIVNAIINKLRIPVYIVSGSIGQVDIPENALFKKRLRDGDFKNVLQEIVNIYNTGITKILGQKGDIEEYLNDIFWKHLSSSMDTWISDQTRSSIQKEKSLLRYTLLHMQEYIDEEVEKYHPTEFYICGPIKKHIFTGDIVTYAGNRYIVLTPSCDIVVREDGSRNTNMILLVQIRTLNEIVKNFDSLNSGTNEKNDNRLRLNSFIENKKQNYHFIPKTNGVEAGLIDFQNKLTLPESEINNFIKDNQLIRLATVSTPFLKDIISRYSNYYSRQGSPDFITNEVYSLLFE